jgi:hypothetical protein
VYVRECWPPTVFLVGAEDDAGEGDGRRGLGQVRGGRLDATAAGPAWWCATLVAGRAAREGGGQPLQRRVDARGESSCDGGGAEEVWFYISKIGRVCVGERERERERGRERERERDAERERERKRGRETDRDCGTGYTTLQRYR